MAFASLALSGMSCSSDGPSGSESDPDGITTNGNTITVDLTKFQSLKSSGGFLLIESQKTLVINDSGTIKAFTSVCTHQGCTINKFENQKLKCPCHGSEFSTLGSVVTGPASQSLKAYATSVSGDSLTITKS